MGACPYGRTPQSTARCQAPGPNTRQRARHAVAPTYNTNTAPRAGMGARPYTGMVGRGWRQARPQWQSRLRERHASPLQILSTPPRPAGGHGSPPLHEAQATPPREQAWEPALAGERHREPRAATHKVGTRDNVGGHVRAPAGQALPLRFQVAWCKKPIRAAL